MKEWSDAKTISIIVPAYNEQEVLQEFYERLSAVASELSIYTFEFLFINDGSSDGTLDIIKTLRSQDGRVAYLDLSRNFGKEAAMLAGLDHAQAQAVIIMDADLQNPPELVPEFIKYWEQGYADVYGKRLSRAGESCLKRLGTKVYYFLLTKLAHIPVQVNVGDFRLLDARCVAALRAMRETQRYTKGMFSWIGYKKKEVPFAVAPRAAGVTKWNYAKLFNLAIEGITSYTTVPLRLATIIGFLISLCAILYMLYIIIKTLIYGIDWPGYPSLVSIVLFIGGTQLIVLGIIGEYLGKIFNETKNRPLYLVNEYARSKGAGIEN